jgi:hypothetical protein
MIEHVKACLKKKFLVSFGQVYFGKCWIFSVPFLFEQIVDNQFQVDEIKALALFDIELVK